MKRNEAGAGRFFRQPAILIGKAKNMVVKGTATNKYDYLNVIIQMQVFACISIYKRVLVRILIVA